MFACFDAETTGWGGVKDMGCISRYDFLRGILHQGLHEHRELGVNPYRLGVIDGQTQVKLVVELDELEASPPPEAAGGETMPRRTGPEEDSAP